MTPPHTDPSSRNRRKAPPRSIPRKRPARLSKRDNAQPEDPLRRDPSIGMPAPQMRVQNVLVIEDDPTFAKLLTQILRTSEEGRYQATVADTMRDALDRLDTDAYDVIIADLGLPDSRDYETIESLNRRAPDIPLVVLTGTAEEGVGPSLEAVRRGASYFLRKGNVDAAAVERGIHYATERKQLRDILGEDTPPENEAS